MATKTMNSIEKHYSYAFIDGILVFVYNIVVFDDGIVQKYIVSIPIIWVF